MQSDLQGKRKMATRNKASNNTSSSNFNDSANNSATKFAHGYFRDFSLQAANYQCRQTAEALALLNRSASLLSTAIQPQQFNPTRLEISKFFIDLHAVVSSLPADSDALRACVSLLQYCSRNLEARRAIVEEYRFIPLLTFVLKRTQAAEKVQRLLQLLQDLTFGISITWEEPYVGVLLERLVNIINNATDEEAGELEETHARLALSILVNLCYKNFVVLFLFSRTVNVSNFSKRIQNYGMLSNKMLIILSENVNAPDEKELHLFLRSIFASMNDCIVDWNVPQFRHVVDFLLDSKSHSGLHQAMLSYTHYCEDIERLLDQVEANASINSSNEDLRKQQQICLSLLFRLVCYILELSTIPNIDGSENAISLDSNVARIMEMLYNRIESDICGVEAINLLEKLITIVKKESTPPPRTIAPDTLVVVQLIAISEKPETQAQHITAVLKLLLSLLHQPKTEKLILSKITESYFDKMFAPLMSMKLDMPINTISLEEIEKSIYCLLLLINFAGIAKKAYFEKCCTMLKLEPIQYALARAMNSGSEMLCSAVFQISQFEHFPQAQVAKYISKMNTAAPTITQKTTNSMTDGDQWCNLNAILKSHKTFVNKEVEERLQALIETITNAQQNGQFSNNLATSQIIELFNYKIEKFNCVECSMHKRLEDASNEMTNLTQRINLQNAELQKIHSMNFELNVNVECLQTQCKDLKQQKDNLKRSMSVSMKKLSEQAESLHISEKRLAVKVSEVIVLQKDYNDIKDLVQVKTKELEQWQTTGKENASRIDKLKKTIASYELDVKEKERSIEEKERELAKTHKALEDQIEAKKKSDDVITLLESQLQEKNEQIRSYETELSETEELRKTILSLMESKKPKRKT